MITIYHDEGDRWSVVALRGPEGNGGWTRLLDCPTLGEAMAWVSYLNGGTHPDLLRGQVDI